METEPVILRKIVNFGTNWLLFSSWIVIIRWNVLY